MNESSTHGSKLVTIEVTDLEDAFLLFETLNDRGLDLSAADLLKNDLLGSSSASMAAIAASNDRIQQMG